MNAEVITQQVPVFERDNGRMPVLGLGTFQASGDTCRNAVRTALEIGYRHVDTARMYKNEDRVGLGIKDVGLPREDLFLTTKLQTGALDEKGVHQSCERSLNELQLDYIDLLLIHWPEESVPLETTLGAMTDLKRSGRIRHLGVSNFTMAWMKEAVEKSEEPIFCNQIEYHPFLEEDDVLAFCREYGIALVAYSPLARGRVVKDETLKNIGKKHGKTAAQVALRWLVSQPGVVAIPKGSSEEHIRDNIDIFDFELTDEDFTAVAALEKHERLIDPDFAPDWDS